jgi:hypothetical protein
MEEIRNTIQPDLERGYRTGPILNQGNEPQCVGYSTRQWLTTGAVKNKHVDPKAPVIYKGAQDRDPWPGSDYEGTTVRAAMKYLQELGFIESYLWAFNAEEVARWMLAGLGPVVVGTDWTTDMLYPKPFGKSGEVMVRATGNNIGGHAYLLSYVDLKKKFAKNLVGGFQITNSWSGGWGAAGKTWIPFEDIDRLIKQHGEAAMAKEILVQG